MHASARGEARAHVCTQVACELSEQLVVDNATRVDHIAGFYRVRSGRITAAKIYREGSADLSP